MKKYKKGDRVILPAVKAEGIPEQRATVLKNEGDLLLVEIDPRDRTAGDVDGLTEIDPAEVKND